MIDANFKYKKSRWQDIYAHLKSKGFEVYPPGVKTGECMRQYIIVKNDGSNRLTSFSTDDDLYSVMCYVPQQAYSKLEPFVQEVKKVMKDLEPMILPYGTQTPSYYDNDYKAHMISIEYKNHKKNL